MQNVKISDIRRILILSNPHISRFNPLDVILFYDDFDNGINGWTEIIGNYPSEKLGDLDSLPADFSDMRPPMLSNIVMFDIGSHGSLSGHYCLKLATRPNKGHIALAGKRCTWPFKGKIKIEAYLTFKPEGPDGKINDVRAFRIGMDIQDDKRRSWPSIRYLISVDDRLYQKWQYFLEGRPDAWKVAQSFETVKWNDVKDGEQEFCYNETPTKINWHYVSFTFDLRTWEYIELVCNDKRYDLSGIKPKTVEPYPLLRGLMNIGMFIQTNSNRRAFLYVDSILVSIGDV
ncbi:MAG: DUF6772 family protein [Nitrososphaeria archaeon]